MSKHLDAAERNKAEQVFSTFATVSYHGATRVLDGGDGRGAGAAVMPLDLDHVGVGLGHAAGDYTDAGLGNQLH